MPEESAPKSTPNSSPWSHKLKQAAWIGLALLGSLAAAVVAVPHFVDLAVFKGTYLPLFEEALNRSIDVGEVRLGLIPAPSVRLSGLRISENPSFAESTFFSARQVQLRVKFLPLLRGRFEITELILEKPIFNLVRQPDGTFNYADIAGRKRPVQTRREGARRVEPAKPVPVLPLIPSRMRIRDGQLNLMTQGKRPVVVRGIDLFLKEFSTRAPFPFRASFDYPGIRTVSLEGELAYQEEKARLELKNSRFQVHDLTLPVRGNVTHLFTAPRFQLDLAGDNVDARPVFQVLSVFDLAPRDTEISGPMDLRIAVSGPSNRLVTQLRGLFKDVKVDGKRALKGRLDGEVSISLPSGGGPTVRRLQGNGRLVARDGELTNVDLINKIQRVTGMIGLSKDQRREATTFRTLQAEFVIGGGLAEFTRLYLSNPQLEVSGHGTMTLEQPALNLALDTKLSQQASTRVGYGRAATVFRDRDGRIVVPLKVTGPIENPAVSLNAEKAAVTGMPQKIEKGFGSFFKQLFRNH